MTSQAEQTEERELRRAEAARRIRETHNQPCSPGRLANLASEGGGPPFRYVGRYPFYPICGLDAWAMSRRGPLVRSTAEARGVGQSKSDKAEGTKLPVQLE
jgi:hypothetical protein